MQCLTGASQRAAVCPMSFLVSYNIMHYCVVSANPSADDPCLVACCLDNVLFSHRRLALSLPECRGSLVVRRGVDRPRCCSMHGTHGYSCDVPCIPQGLQDLPSPSSSFDLLPHVVSLCFSTFM